MDCAGSRIARPQARLRIIAGAAVLLAAPLTGLPPGATAGVPQRDYESPRDPGFEYVSPRPGSALVSPWNNIAFRQGSAIDPGSLSAARLTVVGAATGPHDGELALSDDARTVVFRPARPFAPGERVEVRVGGGIRNSAGDELPWLAFEFTVGAVDPAEPWDPGLSEALSDGFPLGPAAESEVPGAAAQNPAAAACGPLPASYPPLSLLQSDLPEPGYVFLSPFRNVTPGHLLIVDNLGIPIFYRRIPMPSTDFKRQPDGRLTYFSASFQGSLQKFYALDESYAVVDSFATGNGYRTDSHDLQLLPGGHALLMSYDPQTVRMDTVVSGGRPNAIVVGLIVQELDAAKNVVFQWRSWDHFKITDANSNSAPLTAFAIDYVHGNAVELDFDGNLLISCRHMNEITKISRQTGEILWRMGLRARNNQFTFVDDPRPFSHQHDIRRLPNGHITLFDNGNEVPPLLSRAVEYEVDEAAKRATLVWEYRNTPDTYGPFMGSVQRRAGGGTMIGWGGTDIGPRLTDLHADGTKAFEIGLAGGTWTYRAFRFPWRTTRFVTDATSLDFGDVLIGEAASRSLTVRNPSPVAIMIDCAFSTDPAFEVLAPLPLSLAPGEAATVEVRFRPAPQARSTGKIYLRSTGTQELIAQDVEVAGTGVTNRPPDCRAARATPGELWPPNHRLVPIAIEGVTDPDGDPVTIEATAVTQDESVSAAQCPDAVLEGGTAWLRAERAGAGNGRVYEIGFTARDPAGASCTGTVRVCVPHDLGVDEVAGACHDDGQSTNSLEPCPGARHLGPQDAAAPERTALQVGRAEGSGVAIEFELAEAGEVSLAVFDLAGRRVVTLESGRRGPGSQRTVWNTAGVAAGMYFCRIRTASTEITRPVLVVK